MICASPPSHATALCITIATALLVDAVPTVAAFSIHQPTPHGPRVAWTPSSAYRTIEITTTTSLRLFGNIFGKDEARGGQRDDELARISIPAAGSSSSSSIDDDVAYDSLSIMIREWSKSFVVNDLGEKKITGLTTPVEVVIGDEDDVEHDDVVKSSGVRLLFKRGTTGGRSAYRDKDDVGRNDRDEVVEGRRENADAEKEGGVEVRVEKTSNGGLRVIASRCDIEEETMVKEMSEGVIVASLGKTVAAWRKERATLR